MRAKHITAGTRFYITSDPDFEYKIIMFDDDAQVCIVQKFLVQRVLDGCFTDNNPFSAANEGASVLNLIIKKSRNFQPERHGVTKYTMRVLSLSMRRVETLMEILYANVMRDTVLIDVKQDTKSKSVGFKLNADDVRRLMRVGKQSIQQFLKKK